MIMFSSNFFICSPGVKKKKCRWLSCTDLHIHWLLYTTNKPVKLLRGTIFHKRVQNFAEHWTLLVTHFSVVVSIIFSKQIRILLVVSKFPSQSWYYDCVLIYWVTRSLLFFIGVTCSSKSPTTILDEPMFQFPWANGLHIYSNKQW